MLCIFPWPVATQFLSKYFDFWASMASSDENICLFFRLNHFDRSLNAIWLSQILIEWKKFYFCVFLSLLQQWKLSTFLFERESSQTFANKVKHFLWIFLIDKITLLETCKSRTNEIHLWWCHTDGSVSHWSFCEKQKKFYGNNSNSCSS